MSQETTIITQARDGADVDQGKKWSDSRFTLQVEQTGFADRWGCLEEGRVSGGGEGGRASALCQQKG